MIEDAIEYLGHDVNIEHDLTEMVLGAPSNGAEQIEKLIKGAADIVAEASIVIGGFDPLKRIKTASTVENDLRMMFSFAEADIKHMPHAAKKAVITRQIRPKRTPKTKKKKQKGRGKKGRGEDDEAAAAQADIDDFSIASEVVSQELDLTNEIITDEGFLDFIEGGSSDSSSEEISSNEDSDDESDDYLVDYTDIDDTNEESDNNAESNEMSDTEQHQLPF
jgi:hypothetical protein